MMTYSGIPKKITATKLASGAQVYDVDAGKIGKLGTHLPITHQWPIYYLDGSPSDFLSSQLADAAKIKIFVVEYDTLPPQQRTNLGTDGVGKYYKQQQIKYVDWQRILDEDLLDNDSSVSFQLLFQTIVFGGARTTQPIAKIVDSSQTLYTVAQAKNLFEAGGRYREDRINIAAGKPATNEPDFITYLNSL